MRCNLETACHLKDVCVFPQLSILIDFPLKNLLSNQTLQLLLFLKLAVTFLHACSANSEKLIFEILQRLFKLSHFRIVPSQCN